MKNPPPAGPDSASHIFNTPATVSADRCTSSKPAAPSTKPSNSTPAPSKPISIASTCSSPEEKKNQPATASKISCRPQAMTGTFASSQVKPSASTACTTKPSSNSTHLSA